jgi:hypothetical protein
MQIHTKTPERPFGVTLAILASVFVYSVLPLLWLGLTILIEQRLNEISEVRIPIGSDEVAPIATGGSLDLGIGTTEILVQMSLSLGFLFIALLAWRGKSRFMRYLFLLAVISLSTVMIAARLLPLFETPRDGISGGSLEAVFDFLSNGHILLMIFLPIYVIWYLNRGPARAFYRGYYLNEPDSQSSR